MVQPSVGSERHKVWAQWHAPNANLTLTTGMLASELEQAIHKDLQKKDSDFWPLWSDIEVRLSKHIRGRLEQNYGKEDDLWWYDGIPENIRLECAARWEEGRGQGERYGYTYFIDLVAILDKRWRLFEGDFGRVCNEVKAIKRKSDLLNLLEDLNEVRNRHAHAVRAPKPGGELHKKDCEFVQQVKEILDQFCQA